MGASALLHAIVNVVLLCPYEQMLWIHTARVIAAVKNVETGGNLSHKTFI
jgi:hypothetical protein